MAIEEGEAVMMAVLVSFVDEDPLHSSTSDSMGSSSSSAVVSSCSTDPIRLRKISMLFFELN